MVLRTSAISTGWQFWAESWRVGQGYLGYGKIEPLAAEVPGHVHLDLVRNQVISPPFQGQQELGAQWVDSEVWVYRVEFLAAPSPALPSRRLRFEGLDTVCEVRLNGQRIAEHDNMFEPLEVQVDESLRSGVNVLEVRFLPAVLTGLRRRTEYLRERELPSDIVRFEERAFVRKAAYMFGWDWGPRLVSAGIWKPVHLVEFASRILDVQVTQQHEEGAVSVACRTETEGAGQVVHFWRAPGEEQWTLALEGEWVRFSEPALWWPAGAGSQPLYEFRSCLIGQALEPGASFESVQAQALDVRTQRIGLRRLTVVQEEDSWGRSFRFVVNGRRLWCVGANWIPDSSFPSEVTRDRLRERLSSAVAMNMNMLRVWGGGYYESDDFYDLCDELGLLVWQDFPFACSYAPEDADAVRALDREARSAIVRLRNHPSLALWCGNNENSMMFEAKWDDAAKHPPHCHGETLWNDLLPQLVERWDPGRAYIPTSPFSPDPDAPANADHCGDQHNWDVWHGRGDWVHYRDSSARFVSEFGFASAPSIQAWKRVFGEVALDAVDVRHPIARWHDKTKKGYEVFLGLVEQHYGTVSSLEHWVYVSQLNQRDALTAAVEHYRASSFCNGTLIWQLNDCYPAQSWSVLDCTGAWKAAAIELRRLYAPCMASLEVRFEQGVFYVNVTCVVDNQPRRFAGPLILEARDSITGECLRRWERHADLAPGERRTVLDARLEGLDPRRTVLWCDWAGQESKRLLCEPKDLRSGDVRWRGEWQGRDLILEASGPVLDAWILSPEVERAFFSLRTAGRVCLTPKVFTSEVKLRWLWGEARFEVC